MRNRFRMNRRDWMMLSSTGLAMRPGAAQTQDAAPPAVDLDTVLPDQLMLKDYRPKSIYKIHVSEIQKAKYPAIDCHHHAQSRTPEQLEQEVKIMDAAGLESSVAFIGVGEGPTYRANAFDDGYKLYSSHPKRFYVYTGLDMRGCDQPGWRPDATIAELERCHKMGAVGVGELHDKGMGIGGVMVGPPNWRGTMGSGRAGRGATSGAQQPRTPVQGFHPDAPQLDAIWEKCADLGMPVNLHVSDPYWSYLPQNRFNDGLMNGYSWRLDNKPGIMGHNELIESYEAAAKRHPRTVFIASHLANLDYDLTRLGQIFERNPNFYVDFSARFHETCTIPRTTAEFLKKWAHRVTYGTDIPFSQHLFSLTYRILETTDEHFYDQDFYFNFNYHWPMYGMGLPDDVLKKVYRDSALSAFKLARSKAKG
ncbi:Amidohydrolase 2 [Candidatus Sulfopaludibacter sp. SbA6]|nr:Amidohydrolase 2 [Candidatus Sulfopaludibacter sp. SbA6]